MMKHPRIVLLIITFTMATLCQNAFAEWRIYKNERFGFEVTYPAHFFKPGPAPANEDGRNFSSNDGQAQINAWGSYNSLDQTPRTYLAWVKQEVGVVDKATYERIKKNWMVISGFKGDMIYYEKTIFSCRGEILNSVSLTYPVAQKAIFNSLVGKIAKSLRPGTGYGSSGDCN